MSTKVYEAYRLERGHDLWAFLRDAREKATRNAKAVLRNILYSLADDVDTTSEAYQSALREYPANKEYARMSVAHRHLYKSYRDQLLAPERSMHDYSASLTVREFKRRFYFIPYRGSPFGVTGKSTIYADVFAFLKRDKRLTDFSFWDNTDRPDHVTHGEWAARGRVWGGLCEEGSWDDFLVLEIVSKDNFYKVDPFNEWLAAGGCRVKASRSSARRRTR